MSFSASLYPSSRIPPVRVLLSTGSPAAVAGFVSFGVVDAINGMFKARSMSHVGQEVREAGIPAIADGDARSTVEGIRRIADVTTTRAHRTPGSVGDRVRQAMRISAGLITSVAGKFRFGRFGVLTSESRRSWLELSRIAQSVLSTCTSWFAAKSGFSFIGHPAIMPLAGASRFTSSWHEDIVTYRRVLMFGGVL